MLYDKDPDQEEGRYTGQQQGDGIRPVEAEIHGRPKDREGQERRNQLPDRTSRIGLLVRDDDSTPVLQVVLNVLCFHVYLLGRKKKSRRD